MGSKVCKQCMKNFSTEDEDLVLCKKFEVGEPSFCVDCRQQRKFAYRNESSLYRRDCDKCGKAMIAMFPPNCAVKVYCDKCWWNDKFEPLKFGQDFDFNRSFFEQFAELVAKTPLPHLIIGNGENSDYTNYSWANKNCYMISASDYSEDCYYGTYLFRSKNCIDCTFVSDSELCYQCVDCKKCYDSNFLEQCMNCISSDFCFDCKDCQNCFSCMGLRRKEYHVFNKPCSKEEYKRIKAEVLESFGNIKSFAEKFASFKLKFPHKFADIENCENCTGNHLLNSKDLKCCFDSVESQDLSYTSLGLKTKDCFDCVGVASSELCYETVAAPEDYNLRCCAVIWPKSTFLDYCLFSRMSNYCFGCVSLHKNQYCILNKQYKKDEYGSMVSRIIEHMKKTGEWGEFFPVNISPFSYNETIANDFYPLEKVEVLKRGWKWV